MDNTINVAFVTHFCPHYRVRTFELFARCCNVEYLFYSQGKEWYGQGIHGVRGGAFPYTYLQGFNLIGGTRVAPALISRLWRGNYNVIVKCVNGRFALPVTYILARLRRSRFVLWTGIWTTLDTRFHRLAFPITRWIYHHADAIVVYGEHVKQYLQEQGVPSERIFVAAHAVDNSLYSGEVNPLEQSMIKTTLSLEGRKVVLYLGRLEAIKGLQYLLHAFAALNVDDSVLVLAGEGSLSGNLKALARELGIEQRVRFVGYVSPEAAKPYYAIADVFVLPSVTMRTGKETWGLVVNEAMNQGLPVIATDAVGAAAGGLVQSGVNGFVVPERDSAALTEAMERILTDDKLKAQMGRSARRIVAGWNNEQMVSGFQRAIAYATRQKAENLMPASSSSLNVAPD
jgi:glycosyltransferase involved in cell wall biosynthesis